MSCGSGVVGQEVWVRVTGRDRRVYVKLDCKSLKV